jgi:universal stress protein A
MPQLKRILVPVDFSPASRAALEYALFLAQHMNARVDVLHAWQTPSGIPSDVLAVTPFGMAEGIGPQAHAAAERQLAEFLQPFRESAGTPIEDEIAFGPAAPVVRRKAEEGEYDLIVIGTRGRSGLARALLGSVAEAIVRGASCPVLTVRAPDS